MDKVKNFLLKAGNLIKTKASALNRKIAIGVSAAVAVVLVSLIILAVILNQTSYAVLYSGASSTEATEILTYARETLGVTDIKLNSNGDILVPEDQVEEIRVSLSIAGYPKSTFNYDVWNDGVSLFSTETEMLVLQTQQLQDNLMATLKSFDGVDNAIVILNIPKESNYVISTSSSESSAAVTLTLRNELTAEQIDGMYNLVANSVPGLSRENITITDNTGMQLFADYTTSSTDEESEKLQLYYQRLNYSEKLKETMEEAIKTIMDGTYDEFNVSVGLLLNYDNEVTEETIYSGTNVDEDGNQSGIVSDETVKNAAGGIADEGGLVGTTVDADISPDYPTLTVGEDGEFYYEYSRETNYLVNETKHQIEKDGYSIETLSASVVVKSNTDLTTEEETRWRNIIANAIGADVENVSIKTAPFVETIGSTIDGDSIYLNNVSGSNTALLAVIIALGVILIVLLILALKAPGSRKRRRPVARLATANAAPVAAQDDISEIYAAERAAEQNRGEVEFELPSLGEEAPETRDTALKREIQDFSKNNPEIVAQLIRSWLRGDE